MINETSEEIDSIIREKLLDLKCQSGTHSPSLISIIDRIPELKIQVDACFLSNPYATRLFIDYFEKELLVTKDIRHVMEFYPSQNGIIAALIGRHLNIDPSGIFVCNGAIEAIQAIMHRFVSGTIVVNIPTFSSYYEFVTSRTKVLYYQLNKDEEYKLNVSEYIEFVKAELPDTIILINPNNPDGGYIHYDDLANIIQELSPVVHNIIIDESFIHFAYEGDDLEIRSIVHFASQFDNVIIIKSMSKDFGIAGIRCGYAIMQNSKVRHLLANGYLWNINGFAEYFFRLYTRNDFLQEYEIIRKKYISESKLFFIRMKQVKGIKVYPSKANFILIEILDGRTADEISMDLLIKYGIYVRNCSDKIGLSGQYIRLASRSNCENEYIIEAFNALFR
jgi:histidinol-phosphate/aromatic aminotransferase/cobyric acid decarboxylase-like protein